jgi:hypothetical protein
MVQITSYLALACILSYEYKFYTSMNLTEIHAIQTTKLKINKDGFLSCVPSVKIPDEVTLHNALLIL